MFDDNFDFLARPQSCQKLHAGIRRISRSNNTRLCQPQKSREIGDSWRCFSLLLHQPWSFLKSVKKSAIVTFNFFHWIPLKRYLMLNFWTQTQELTSWARLLLSSLLKARLHWRFCSAFSSDVFAIDVHVFCHRYKFKQGKFNGKPWGDAVWKIEKVLFFKTSRPKVHGFACLGCHIHPWRQT